MVWDGDCGWRGGSAQGTTPTVGLLGEGDGWRDGAAQGTIPTVKTNLLE